MPIGRVQDQQTRKDLGGYAHGYSATGHHIGAPGKPMGLTWREVITDAARAAVKRVTPTTRGE